MIYLSLNIMIIFINKIKILSSEVVWRVIMKKIEELYDMLKWYQPIEIQKKGIKLSEQYDDLNLFIQPISSEVSKEIWNNCALIISNKNNEQLKEYFLPLLEWLRDMTWPGALIIKERLLNVPYKMIKNSLKVAIDTAISNKECDWLYNIADLVQDLDNKQYVLTTAKELEKQENIKSN